MTHWKEQEMYLKIKYSHILPFFCFRAHLFNQGNALFLFQSCSLFVYMNTCIFIYKNKYITVFHLVFTLVETAHREFEGGRRNRKEVHFSSAVSHRIFMFWAVEVAGDLSVLCTSQISLSGGFPAFEWFCLRSCFKVLIVKCCSLPES